MFYVSIHAPVKSATILARLCPSFSFCFNPRARKERDFINTSKIRLFLCFNPRARKERDVVVITSPALRPRFNPRARKERDVIEEYRG